MFKLSYSLTLVTSKGFSFYNSFNFDTLNQIKNYKDVSKGNIFTNNKFIDYSNVVAFDSTNEDLPIISSSQFIDSKFKDSSLRWPATKVSKGTVLDSQGNIYAPSIGYFLNNISDSYVEDTRL